MATIGSIEAFDASTSDWPEYSARLEQFIVANGIEEERKVATLLTVIGGPTYKLLRNLLAPEDPASKTYDVLTETLKNHLSPKPLVIAERYKFHKRDQLAGETIAQYVVELRRFARDCEFEGYLETALRDRLVCGIRNEAICKKLLQEERLTFNKAVQIATAAETAARERQSSQLHRPFTK